VLDVPVTVGFGQSLTVSGVRSSDVGGVVKSWTFALDGQTPVATLSSSWTFDVNLASPLALGRHTVTLFVTDDSGNVSSTVSGFVNVV
jgi:hypothetical protein